MAQLKTERIKGVLNTNQGWIIINDAGNRINYVPTSFVNKIRIEVIVRDNGFQSVLTALNKSLL